MSFCDDPCISEIEAASSGGNTNENSYSEKKGVMPTERPYGPQSGAVTGGQPSGERVGADHFVEANKAMGENGKEVEMKPGGGSIDSDEWKWTWTWIPPKGWKAPPCTEATDADVPAIQERGIEWQPVYSCADKSRFLLKDQSGQYHCLRLP